MTSTTLLKKVAREIRYRSLPDIIAQPVEIYSLETVEIDIRQALGAKWPNECRLVSKASQIAKTIAKYGIMDLYFSAPESFLADEYESGFSLLKKLGFLAESETEQISDQEFEIAFTNDPFCLSQLADDIAKNSTLLKLFLNQEFKVGNQILQATRLSAMKKSELPSNYFPQNFKITDACFTNADIVWFFKHFYI